MLFLTRGALAIETMLQHPSRDDLHEQSFRTEYRQQLAFVEDFGKRGGKPHCFQKGNQQEHNVYDQSPTDKPQQCPCQPIQLFEHRQFEYIMHQSRKERKQEERQKKAYTKRQNVHHYPDQCVLHIIVDGS